MNGRKQRIIGFFLSVCLVLGMSLPAYAASGVEAHQKQTTIDKFLKLDFLDEKQAGDDYNPDLSITRAEFASLLNHISALTKDSDQMGRFTDAPHSHPYYADLAKALEAGYMTGTSATTLSPDGSLTREQAAVMVGRRLDLTATTKKITALNRFSDAGSVSSWAVDSVAGLFAQQKIAAAGATLLPQAYMSRADAMVMLDGILNDLLPEGKLGHCH